MPRPYSTDLRSRALAACDAGERPSAAARRFQVARATVYLWLKQRRDEGRTAAKRPGGGSRPMIRDRVAEALGRLAADRNDLTLSEYADALEAETGVRAAPSMLCRAFQRLNLPRKKDPARRRAGHGRSRAGAGGVARRDPRRARPRAAGVPG